jgi:hypothetical protein
MALARSVRSVAARVSAVAARPVAAVAGVADFRSVHTEARIKELGHTLPTPAEPAANYIMCHRVGNLIYTGESVCRVAAPRPAFGLLEAVARDRHLTAAP